METFELTVKQVEIKNRTPFGPRYAWQQGERDEVYLNVTAQDTAGHTVWFSAGAISRTVMSGPGCAVVTYGDHNAWLHAPQAYAVTANMKARPGSGQFEPQVGAGERITVRGLVKKTYPNGGYVLSRVRLVSQE